MGGDRLPPEALPSRCRNGDRINAPVHPRQVASLGKLLLKKVITPTGFKVNDSVKRSSVYGR
jgi:hypothetical protein